MPNSDTRISGALNLLPLYGFEAKWHYRTGSNIYYPDISSIYHQQVIMTNPQTSCTNGIIPPPDPTDEEYAAYFDEMYGEVVRNEIDYFEYADEFEYFDEEYLYEVLYNNPEIMNLGEPEDTAYVNFYNYLLNSNINEFVNVEELIDLEDINQALMDNGAIVAQNLIEGNKQLVNDVYLTSFAEDRYFTESQQQSLEAIAMLTPYIGGDAVYSARVMLGFNPNTYNLPYRKGHFPDSSSVINNENSLKIYPNPAIENLTIEFENVLEINTIFVVYDITGRMVMENQLNSGESKYIMNTEKLESGVYFYKLKAAQTYTGKITISK